MISSDTTHDHLTPQGTENGENSSTMLDAGNQASPE